MTWTRICCRRGGGCPQVNLDGDNIFIKDDDGGIIKLTLIEFRDIDRWLIKGNSILADQKTLVDDGKKI